MNSESSEVKTTVIIPTYDGLAFLKKCLAALARQSVRDFCVLIVDNGSADGTARWLEEEMPETVCVPKGAPLPAPESGRGGRSERGAKGEPKEAFPVSLFYTSMGTNAGFSAAVNTGIRMSTTEYVLLLNNDTEAEEGYLEAMEGCVKRHPRAFSVSSKMIQLGDKSLMDDAGDLYTVIGWAFQRGVGQKSTGYTSEKRIFSACAGSALYRREVFEEIGLFDEIHFAYLEDTDVGYRGRIYGYENYYCPDAVVYHVGSGTSGSRYNSFKVRLAARNSVYLNYKNMPLLQLVLNALPLAFGYAVKTLFFRRRGFGKDYREGLKEGLSTLKKCRHVAFRPGRTGHYIRIELELIGNTFLYLYEFVKRHV